MSGNEDKGFLDGSAGKESAGNAGDTGDVGLIPGSGRSPGAEKWQRTPVYLPEKLHRQRSLCGPEELVWSTVCVVTTSRT